MRWLLLVVAVALVAVFGFKTETTYECSGELSGKGASEPKKLYMELTRYRWVVGLWNDSAGILRVEIPHSTFLYYGHLTRVGDYLLTIGRDDYSGKEAQLQVVGNFSTLSGALLLTIPPPNMSEGEFKGMCKKVY